MPMAGRGCDVSSLSLRNSQALRHLHVVLEGCRQQAVGVLAFIYFAAMPSFRRAAVCLQAFCLFLSSTRMAVQVNEYSRRLRPRWS